MAFWINYLIAAALGALVFYGGDLVDRLLATRKDKQVTETAGQRSSEARGCRVVEAFGTLVGMMALQGHPDDATAQGVVLASSLLAIAMTRGMYAIGRSKFKAAQANGAQE